MEAVASEESARQTRVVGSLMIAMRVAGGVDERNESCRC